MTGHAIDAGRPMASDHHTGRVQPAQAAGRRWWGLRTWVAGRRAKSRSGAIAKRDCARFGTDAGADISDTGRSSTCLNAFRAPAGVHCRLLGRRRRAQVPAQGDRPVRRDVTSPARPPVDRFRPTGPICRISGVGDGPRAGRPVRTLLAGRSAYRRPFPHLLRDITMNNTTDTTTNTIKGPASHLCRRLRV